MIEQNNPHIQFDWTRILKGQADPADVPERRERPRPEQHRNTWVQSPQAAQAFDRLPSEPPETAFELGAVPEILPDGPDPASLDSEGAGPAIPDIEPLPQLVALDEVDELEVPVAPPDDGPVTAAHARLGSEGVSRLRARYADVMAGISDKIADPQRAAELKAQAERLNPDCWVTEDEVRQGLEQYESIFDSLRLVVGRRRRRRRR